MKKFLVYFFVITFAIFLALLSYSVYKKREFETSVSNVLSQIISANSDLVLSVDDYSYSVVNMQPAILGVKIKNTKTLAEINIERIDMSISELGHGDFDLKYNVKNIVMNKRIVYKGVDLTRYIFQKNIFDLMSGGGDDFVKLNLYGKTSYKNGGKRISTQNVVDVAGVLKFLIKTDINDFDYIKSDAIKAIFSGSDNIFYKTLGRLINKVSFINTAASVETDYPERIYYEASSLFLSMDRFDSKRQIPLYEKYIRDTSDLNDVEKNVLKGIASKIKSNSPLRINVLINSDYNISSLITMFDKGVKTRSLMQKNMEIEYSID